MTPPSILVLGTADWNQPIATNQHYIVRELAKQYQVTYVESMGLRRPEMKLRDVRRAFRRLFKRSAHVTGPGRPVPPGVEVVSPRAIPRHRGLTRRFNQRIVDRFAADWAGSGGTRILWTYTPVTYGLEKVADGVVYHCVDLLGKVEGIPEDLIDQSEVALAESASRAIGSSRKVAEHLATAGFSPVVFWPNVADTEVIERNHPAHENRVPNRAVFAGNLSNSKVDFPLLKQLVDDGIDLHLAGPVSEGGGSAISDLKRLIDAGATYHGMLSLDDLASIYWTAEVGIIPYLINPYTQGVSPLKTYEYLAAGLAVVSVPLPSMQPLERHIILESSPEAFSAAVRLASQQSTIDDEQARARIAARHSWTGRGEEARQIIDSIDSSQPDGDRS